jgi:3-methyladenine DNA glycosylase/8-oxoguanine DNA glycosylase
MSDIGDGVTRRVQPEGPVDVAATLGPLRGAGRFVFAGDGIWRAMRTAQGPATLQILPRDGLVDVIEARTWGPGGEWLHDLLPELLDLDGEDDFTPSHPELCRRWRRHPGLRLGRTRSVVEVLLPTIVAQKVPAADAVASWRHVRRWSAERAPGPAELILPPDPARLAELAYHDLHRFGIDRKRADPLLAACRSADRLEGLARRSPAQLAAGLTQFRGIGPWTASVVAVTAIGDADTVVLGDYNLPSAVAWTLAGERRADDARMLELLEPERPHRARAMRLLAAEPSAPPRHGPRMSPTAISGR